MDIGKLSKSHDDPQIDVGAQTKMYRIKQKKAKTFGDVL